MNKDETENPRHLPRVSMRGTWYFPQVIRVRLELTTNGLKDHCYDVLIPDIIGLAETLVEVYPTFSYPISNISLDLMLFTNDGKSASNRLKLNFAYISVVTTEL